MARPRASDHDAKRRSILDHATRLFAERGYARASMAEIAEACGSSKALLYHYYENKEQLLYDILLAHFERIEAAVEVADDEALPPHRRLRALVGALLDAYEGADATHKVQINELGLLPAERQKELKDFERRLVARFAGVLGEINPRLVRNRKLLKPVTMSLFGMVNWSYLWFRRDGGMSRTEYADVVTRIMVDGIAGLGEASITPARIRRRVLAG
jgi:TetR/AcrR family transcriptional regulator